MGKIIVEILKDKGKRKKLKEEFLAGFEEGLDIVKQMESKLKEVFDEKNEE